MSNNNQKKNSKPSDYEYIFKLILIGNSGVGKSSIIQRFMKNTFEES